MTNGFRAIIAGAVCLLTSEAFGTPVTIGFAAAMYRSITTTQSEYVGDISGSITFDPLADPVYSYSIRGSTGASRAPVFDLSVTLNGVAYPSGPGWVDFTNDYPDCGTFSTPCPYHDGVTFWSSWGFSLSLVGDDSLLQSYAPPSDTSYIQAARSAVISLSNGQFFGSQGPVSLFTVPEPGALHIALASLLSLIAVRSTSRGRSERSPT